jgi:hypothetical protein
MKFQVASLDPKKLGGSSFIEDFIHAFKSLSPQGYVSIKSRNRIIPRMPQLIPNFLMLIKMKTTPERTDLAQSINCTIERLEMMQFRGFF